jgi:NAD(P)-dependent dehydrogenase (short-subunit alcohol dehydrogenase family)
MGQVDGRVAVITGGGRGIGEAIATRNAAEGARVVVSSRTLADLEKTLAQAGLDTLVGAKTLEHNVAGYHRNVLAWLDRQWQRGELT